MGVSKRKSLVAQRKGRQRKRMRKQKHVDYQGDDNKSKANSYISKPEDYPSLESLEYPYDPNIACDPDVQNCKHEPVLPSGGDVRGDDPFTFGATTSTTASATAAATTSATIAATTATTVDLTSPTALATATP